MSGGRIFDDKLGFTFEVNLHKKQMIITVCYSKEHDRMYIKTKTQDTGNYPSMTFIVSEQSISIDPAYCAILLNNKFWERVGQVLNNIKEESAKNDAKRQNFKDV